MGANARFVLRVRILTAFLLVVGVLIVGRLYVVQIVHGQEYARRAEAQVVATKHPLLNRGDIYFSAKDGGLVLAATLRPLLSTTTASSSTHQRYYPGNSLAARTLGFVAYNNDDEQKGRYGLERYYESVLGRNGETLYRNFFVELFGNVSGILQGGPQEGDVITTLEPTVQAELERTLARYEADWRPTLLGGAVMDPKTGALLALAVTPSFDLNEFNKAETRVFGNPFAESVYEMGSIMKPLTIAAGLDAGVITEDTTYNDTGFLEIDGKKISNFDGKARGVVPMQEVLNQSLNIGASFVAGKLGRGGIQEYFLERYKLGVETGIDLPGEIGGLVDNLKSGRTVEYYTASFGQGLAVTPVAMLRALAVLANGGHLVTPHLVKGIREENGLTREIGWGEPERVLKQETTTTISRMLTTVVDTSLAHGSIKLPHWSVAAKTGTAQIANPNGGGYYEDKFLHSFFGYVPSFDAKFLVFLFAVEPSGASFASQTWAQPFHSLTQFLINYYEIPPDR